MGRKKLDGYEWPGRKTEEIKYMESVLGRMDVSKRAAGYRRVINRRAMDRSDG